MKKVFGLVFLSLLLAVPAFATMQVGTVVAIDKERLTIQPEVGGKMTLRLRPDMGKKHSRGIPPDSPLGVTPDKIKRGMIVRVSYYQKKDGLHICEDAEIIDLPLGVREIDFAPMLAKDKERVAPCEVQILVASKCGLGNFRPSGRRGIIYKDGASVKRIRDDFKEMLERDEWKVKAEGDSKLLIEAYKKEEVVYVGIEAKRLPKEQQPRVRRLDPSDPSKDKKDKKDK